VNSIVKKTLIGGRYSLRVPLGSGGMAKVFLARDEILERDVALKILREEYADDEEFVERFKREAQRAASLNHSNIVHVYDWGRAEDDKTYYIAMEYVSGGTLKDLILTDGVLPPQIAAQLASQIAEALEAAHERGVVHRDIKSQNVLLTASREVKVADFGIARAASSTTTTSQSGGLLLGTARYMSPEQAIGERVGPRSDLYSLGVVLYEMLTGELPYEADTSGDIVGKHVTEPPQSPRETNPMVPEEIDAVTLRLLAKDPANRYGSAAELITALRKVREKVPSSFANSEPVSADRAVLPTSPITATIGGNGTPDRPAVVYGRRSGNLSSSLGAVFVALLVLLGVTVWYSWSGSEEQQVSRVQDMVSGSPEGLGETFEQGTQATGAKEEALDAGILPEDDNRESSQADANTPQLDDLDFASSDAVLQTGAIGQDPRAGIPVGPDTEVDSQEDAVPQNGFEQASRVGTTADITASSGPEQVSVPDVSGGSVQEASRALSGTGFTVVGTKTQPSPEPAGTVLETDPPIGAVVERGTEVTIIMSNGPPSQQNGNDGSVENAAPEAEVSPTPTQPSKKKDSNGPAGQKSSNAAPASEMSSTPIKRDKKSFSK
jgi:eukaryotic-like serine/threonine-protein kinase